MKRLFCAALAAAALLGSSQASAATYIDLPLQGITTFEIVKPVGSGYIDLTASWDRFFNIGTDQRPGFETIGDYGYSAGVSCELSLNCSGVEYGLFGSDFIKLTTKHTANAVLVTIRTSLANFDYCATGSFADTCALYYQAGVQFDGEARNVVMTPVPEPGTWALMIAGFGLAASALRRARPRRTVISCEHTKAIRW